MKSPIYHVASPSDAASIDTNSHYQTASLETEGFIHCCTAEQLPGVLQRYYEGIEQVVLLSLKAQSLTSDLVLENTVGGTELFPHIYGVINKDAIADRKTLDRDSMDRIAQSDVYTPTS